MCFNKETLFLLALLIFGSLDGSANAAKDNSFKHLAFRPIGIRHQSRALKQDFRSVAGSLIGELVDSVFERDKQSEADDGVYLGQIVGGADASPDRYPFVCSLRHRQTKKHFCGGSLIRKNVVLTAAHCVDHRDANIIRPIVHIGRYHRSQNTQDYEEIKTKKTIIHPNWDPDSNANDLALIFLEKDSSYQPIALKGEKATPNAYLAVLGWGRTEEGGSTSERLQEVVVPVLRQDECRKAYGSRISDAMFCAGVSPILRLFCKMFPGFLSGGKDACQGDSGGPIIRKERKGADQLVGVVSWGHGCARQGKPGVYASISHAREWIDNEIKKFSNDHVSTPPKPKPPKENKPKDQPPKENPSSTTTDCHCSEDGWSGNVRTSRKGCRRHLRAHGDDDYFCMVKEGTQCATATPSEAYPGAAWMLCEASEEEITDPSGLDLIDIWRRRPPSIKLKLGPLSFKINLGNDDDEWEEACECTEDGLSGSVKTDFNGCKQHSGKQGRHDYWCMVKGGATECPEAKASTKFKGAAWRGCDPKKE